MGANGGHRIRTVMAAAFWLVILAAPQLSKADSKFPYSHDLVNDLLPDEKAQRLYRDWKGIRVTPGKKAESNEIPSVTLYINFDFNSDDLTPDATIVLTELGRALLDPKLREYVFVLQGHTDAVGSDAYNLELSDRRAQSARRFLVDEFRVSPRRLIATGYGESKLLRPEEPDSELNRRVEIKNIGPIDE